MVSSDCGTRGYTVDGFVPLDQQEPSRVLPRFRRDGGSWFWSFFTVSDVPQNLSSDAPLLIDIVP